jgi:DNA-binding winged helix-turn-helix (wHTH) protein/TolB-like protein/Tfp pilus assembly protein PilF
METPRAEMPVAYEFGSFRLEVRERRLLSPGGEIPLTPKAFDVLLALVSRHPHLVTRETLMGDVWRESFVEEGNLSYTISLLRKAIGDDADAPAYIQTVAKRGYRFIATVRQTSSAPPQAPPPRALLSRGALPTFGVVALCLVAVTLSLQLGPLSAPSLPHIRSIAVLPFNNLGGHTEDDWIADGLTHVLIEEVSREPELRVISPVSAMRFKRTTQPLSEIADELGVEGIVVGSVLRLEERIRIGLQIYHARPERQIFANSYEGDVSSLRALYTQVALDITRRAGRQARNSGARSDERTNAVDASAYESFLKGRVAATSLNRDGLTAAIDHFQRALDWQPEYPAAMTELAFAEWLRASFLSEAGSLESLQHMRLRALELAERAAVLEDTLADAHATLGWFHFWSLDWAAAERAFVKALGLDPGNVRARHGYAFYLTAMARYDEALVHMQHARSLDPRNPTIAIAAHWPFFCARRYEAAASALVEARTLAPKNALIYVYLGTVRSFQDRHEEALADLNMAARLGAQETARLLTALAGAYARANQPQQAQDVVAKLAGIRQSYVNGIWLARAHAMVGNKEAALSWLEQAYEATVKVDELTTIRHPSWDVLRDEPRFQAVLRKMAIEP